MGFVEFLVFALRELFGPKPSRNLININELDLYTCTRLVDPTSHIYPPERTGPHTPLSLHHHVFSPLLPFHWATKSADSVLLKLESAFLVHFVKTY